MTYNERIRAITEEMAGSSLDGLKKIWYNVYMNNARVAVKHMAEAATDALVTDYSGALDSDGAIHIYLLEHGLIPTDQEAVEK